MQTIYKLYSGTITVTTAAVAQLDIQKAGRIEAIWLDLNCSADDALNDGGAVEISFGSAAMNTINDTRQVIATLAASQGFLTSGGGPVGKCLSLSGLDLVVGAGERIWMHIDVSGTSTVRATAYLYVGDGSGFRVGR